ncbi:hypothetical protein VIGAN_04094900, partial [Vigna angularis var. angularis]
MSKKRNLFHPKLTLGQFGIQSSFSQHFKHCPKVIFMFFPSFRIDKYVIYKHHHKLVQEWSENSIHIVHEYGWSISHTKRHNYILIVSIPGPEC